MTYGIVFLVVSSSIAIAFIAVGLARFIAYGCEEDDGEDGL